MSAFEEYGVVPEIIQAVNEMGWHLPREIQVESIPLILGGGDVLMAAETGSGKTGAFCLPVLQIVHEALCEASGEAAAAKAPKRPPQEAKMSPVDRETAFAIAEDGLLCQSREQHQWQGARANIGAVKGKHYYEVKVTDEGLCRVGWATATATLELGVDAFGFGFGGTGKKSNNRKFDTYGEPFALNDIIGCFLSYDDNTISFSKNGKDLGVAYELPAAVSKTPLFPACTIKNAELLFNFGADSFAHPPGNGFKPMTHQPHNCIAAASSAVAGPVRPAGSKGRPPLAIIIEPSRELAEQTYNQVSLFKKYLPQPGVQEVLLIGGLPAGEQAKQLEKGADIVVGTPGRVADFVKSGKLDLSQIRFYVLDEVDGLLSQGHTKLLQSLYTQIPKETSDGRRLQLVVCSATLHSPEVKRMAETIMHFPTWIDLKGLDSVPETVHHCVAWIDPTKDTWWHEPGACKDVRTDGVHFKDNTQPGTNSKEMYSEAVKRLKYKFLLAAITQHKMDQAIIFCRTKVDCDNLEKFFQARGGSGMVSEFSCVCMHGDRRVDERRRNLQRFKDGEVSFLICTDVAARGIDVAGVPYVINMTLPPPDEKANYVHRIGRVGRAERMGLAISLVSTVPEKVWYHKCGGKSKSCKKVDLVEKGGCCIWYNEKQCIAAIEEHLGESIPVVDETMAVGLTTMDGKVTYGEKRTTAGAVYHGHADVLAPSVAELSELEHAAQTSFLHLRSKVW